MKKYNPQKAEKKWRIAWEKAGLYRAKDASRQKKFYALMEFPYPSGDGLHVGHLRADVAMDIIARKRRMQGYNVLYPIGWDAFGLPTENYAIKTGIHPKVITKRNTDNFRRQLKSLGLSYDWSREVNTTDPAYYKWTQWIFLQFFRAGLAYKAKMAINWCPKDKIGLANEEVVGGKCERCGTPIEQREKEQWMLKITAYADKLLAGLNNVDFLPEIKQQQVNWIGRKEGINITYPIEDTHKTVTVFTTRPDTNFGATFVVLAPESELALTLPTADHKEEVREYIEAARRKTPEERLAEGRKKTGVFTGRYAINHLTGARMPIWVSDFVLANVGTGALVGVPGHDVRDFEFAKTFGLPIMRVVVGPDGDSSPILRAEQVQEEAGTMINSGFLNGLDIKEATRRVMDHIEAKSWGKRIVQYHLRDWVFSRQRYWGEPIPIINCPACGYVPVPDKDLPLELPNVKNYLPRDDGESPLASVTSWVKAKCPQCKGAAKRETDVMPNWAGSSWYFLRYVDPKNKKAFADYKKLKYWLPVDWYNGGMEHVTLHLLYSRFWNLFLSDKKFVPVREPYKKRTAHGMILGSGGVKMSKSKGNVVNPDSVIEAYGADALRLYEMFMGPFDQAIAWDPQGIEGTARFLGRIWTLSQEKKIADNVKDRGLERVIHKTIKKVGDDIETMSFNTAVSALMICVNEMHKAVALPKKLWRDFLLILAPFAPFMAEELWQQAVGGKKFESVHLQEWPAFSKKLLVSETAHIVVQVNGKLRDKLEVPADASQQEVERLALASEKVRPFLAGREPKRVIYIPQRLVNIVV